MKFGRQPFIDMLNSKPICWVLLAITLLTTPASAEPSLAGKIGYIFLTTAIAATSTVGSYYSHQARKDAQANPPPNAVDANRVDNSMLTSTVAYGVSAGASLLVVALLTHYDCSLQFSALAIISSLGGTGAASAATYVEHNQRPGPVDTSVKVSLGTGIGSFLSTVASIFIYDKFVKIPFTGGPRLLSNPS